MFPRRPLKKTFLFVRAQPKYITNPKKAKILFVSGKANRDRISFEIAREANLTLAARRVAAEPQKQWQFLKIAEEKTAKIPESLILVWLYNEVRTFFQKNL